MFQTNEQQAETLRWAVLATHLNGAADSGSAAFHPGGNLVQRAARGCVDRSEQVALLAHRLGSSGVPAQLLDQSGEARRKGAR